MPTEEAAAKRSAQYLAINETLQRIVDKGYLDKDIAGEKDRKMAEGYQVEQGTGIPLSIRGSLWAKKEIDERYFTYINVMGVAKRLNPTKPPSSTIITWMRSYNTLEFLYLWEEKNNPTFDKRGYCQLVADIESSNITVTPKIWCERTNAIGIMSKRGHRGGTYVHCEIACAFEMWIKPEYRLQIVEKIFKGNEK